MSEKKAKKNRKFHVHEPQLVCGGGMHVGWNGEAYDDYSATVYCTVCGETLRPRHPSNRVNKMSIENLPF